MKSKVFKDIKELNQLSLVRYLSILGYKPTHSGHDCTLYRMYLDDVKSLNILIDHKTNEFTDIGNRQKGTLVDFACLLFGITSIELCNNIMLYGIDRLMQFTHQTI
jgi:hypothetical protein